MPDNSLDMGTGFDCFDAASTTFHDGITKDQATARRTLLEAMHRHGFRNYPREWWHFTFVQRAGDNSASGGSFDTPVPARR